jgi:DNA-directed RNA polymerase subunit RPC12/RpoP
MTYLIKCPCCNTEVDGDCESCPNCQHNIKKDLIEKDICPKCGKKADWSYYPHSIEADSKYGICKCPHCDYILKIGTVRYFDYDEYDKYYNSPNYQRYGGS